MDYGLFWSKGLNFFGFRRKFDQNLSRGIGKQGYFHNFINIHGQIEKSIIILYDMFKV